MSTPTSTSRRGRWVSSPILTATLKAPSTASNAAGTAAMLRQTTSHKSFENMNANIDERKQTDAAVQFEVAQAAEHLKAAVRQHTEPSKPTDAVDNRKTSGPAQSTQPIEPTRNAVPVKAIPNSNEHILSRIKSLETRFSMQIETISQNIAPLLVDYSRRMHAQEKAEREHDESGIGDSNTFTNSADVTLVNDVAESDHTTELGGNNAMPTKHPTPPRTITPSSEEDDESTRVIPLAIRHLAPTTSTTNSVPLALQPLPSATSNLETFTLSFLRSVFGGDEYSPGLYFPATGPSTHANNNPVTPKELLPKCKTYYILDAALEPFVPQEAGHHGAKLSVFFRDSSLDINDSFNDDGEADERYQRVPLFVALDTVQAKEKEYTYLGHYSQTRWSDRLDYERVAELVPHNVKSYWANLLTRPERPEWLEREIMQAFWPKPQYLGVLPGAADEDMTVTGDGDGATTVTGTTTGGDGRKSRVERDVAEYIEELREWESEARMKVKLLKAEHVMDAFGREDAAAEPGYVFLVSTTWLRGLGSLTNTCTLSLRFWYEYLECVGFDRNWYYMLATEKKKRWQSYGGGAAIVDGDVAMADADGDADDEAESNADVTGLALDG